MAEDPTAIEVTWERIAKNLAINIRRFEKNDYRYNLPDKTYELAKKILKKGYKPRGRTKSNRDY